MPVLVVENKADGTVAYCTMNEGIGKVLRFGAYSQEVVDRLRWMRDVLGPVLSAALRKKEGGVNLNVLVAKAITRAMSSTSATSPPRCACSRRLRRSSRAR